MKYPTIDVVIPSYKPGASFRTLLSRLSDQTYPVRNILIINTDEGKFDGSVVRRIPRAEVFHISKAEFDHAGTRNMGAGFSDADYLLYMTQDALPADKTLVERLLSAFRDPRVKISYARQLPSRECRVIEGYTRSFNYPSKSRVKSFDDLEELGIKTFFCSNVCACYDRVFLREMGGFSAPCIFNEDMIFAGRAIKLGYSVAYVAEARVIHSHNYSAVQQFRRNFDNGVSQAMHPEIFRGIDTEGEGGRLVKNTIKYLRSVGYGYMVPRLLFHSAAKYAGFRMGRAYKVLPRWLIHMCTMNPGFWAYKAGDD